jgi:tetratricopeptide (TPR) repeat protein
MPKAKAAALKALELDNGLASAHSNLGTVAFWYEWDWPTSERELLRSIELDPTSSHREYGNYLTAMGRIDEAISEGEKAQRYAPLDLASYADLPLLYAYAGRYDQAIETARRGIELDEAYWYAHVALGLAFERKGQFPEAIAEMERAHSLDTNNPWVTGYLGYVYAKAGKTTEAQKVLDQLKELSKSHWVSPFNMAIVYAGLNEKDRAFEWISKAIEARGLLALARVEIGFDNLRGDPRFNDLLKRLNLRQ